MGKLIYVTATTPDSEGVGKTTASLALTRAFNANGRKTVACLRQPSAGPTLGIKGGGSGVGYSKIVDHNIDLGYQGAFLKIAQASNFIASIIDASIFHDNKFNIDPSKIYWKRNIDLNERSLKEITYNIKNYEVKTGFVITPASEMMITFVMSPDKETLINNIKNIIVAETFDGQFVKLKQFNATNAIMALIDDAFEPIKTRTASLNDALIHMGPFANLSLGNNGIASVKQGIANYDYCITEGGFGSELGFEKFMNIIAPENNMKIDVLFLVTNLPELLNNDYSNLERHIAHIKNYGIDPVVIINLKGDFTPSEKVFSELNKRNIKFTFFDAAYEDEDVIFDRIEPFLAQEISSSSTLYTPEMPWRDKLTTISNKAYLLNDITIDEAVAAKVDAWIAKGLNFEYLIMAKGFKKIDQVKIVDAEIIMGGKILRLVDESVIMMPGLGASNNYERM